MFWKNELKRYFLSPLFAPVFTLCVGATFVNVILTFFPESVLWISEDEQLIDNITLAAYAILFASFGPVFKDFRKDRKLTDYFIYIFLTLAAFLREQGIQHWWTVTGGSVMKTRFFIDPDNPLVLRIAVLSVTALVVVAAAYVLCKYARYWITGFFRMDTLSWSIVSLGICGVFSKFADRLCNGPIGKMCHFDERVGCNVAVTEEVAELFLPLLGVIILWQFHFLLKDKNNV